MNKKELQAMATSIQIALQFLKILTEKRIEQEALTNILAPAFEMIGDRNFDKKVADLAEVKKLISDLVSECTIALDAVIREMGKVKE